MIKNRKIVLIFLLIISILSFLFLSKTTGVSFNNYFISKEAYDNLVSTHSYNYNLILDEISFDGYDLIRDKKQNLYYSLIEGSDSAYNPKVRYSAAGCEIVLFGSKISDYNIENNQSIKLIIYNDSEYNEYQIIVTKLPIMTIIIEDELTTSNISNGSMLLFDNGYSATSRITTSNMSINIRGHMSLEFPKSSYRMTLYDYSTGNNLRENNLSLLGLRKDADYVLYADFNETEKVRNVFSTNLWKYSCASDNRYGIDNGNEYKFLELIVNGEYNGLYALGYKIDTKAVGLNDNEVLYKLQHLHTAEKELDLNAEGPLTNYEVVQVGENIDDEWALLRNYYQMLFSSKKEDIDSLYNLSDIENNIDYFLFINLIQGIDNWWEEPGCLNNCYLTAKTNEDGTYSILMTPWDFDKSWSTDLDNYNIIELPYDYSVVTKNCPTYYLCEYSDEFKNYVKEKYWSLRSDKWSYDFMLELIDIYEEDIFESGAFLRDFARWPDEEYVFSHHSNPDAKLYTFRDIVKYRLEEMDKWINNF